MKPILLHGHERSLTQIKYNRQGDLLFSVAKDSKPTVWFSNNGERLGTFRGHNGACWAVDVDWYTRYVATGAADNTARVWDCETGAEVSKLDTVTAVRTVAFSSSGRTLALSTDQRMGKPCEIHFYDLSDSSQMKNNRPYKVIAVDGSKVTSAIWGPYDDTFITGHENGTVKLWDAKSMETRAVVDDQHDNVVNDIQLAHDKSAFITASKDTTAKLWDPDNLDVLKTFKTNRPVNSAAISPIRDQAILGGGQDAREVTTTTTRERFEVRFFHSVFEDEIGRVKGHFGPINTVAFHPDGRSFSSGGEDGYVRIHHFDESYFKFTIPAN